MRIGLLTDLDGQRVWQRWLAADLARRGHDLVLLRPASADQRFGCPSGLRLALWLDPIWFRLKGEHAFDELAGGQLVEVVADRNSSTGDVFDVVIDVSAAPSRLPRAHRVIRLRFNDAASEVAAVAAILGTEPVAFSIDDGDGAQRETARPGIERRGCLTLALDNLLSCVVELLVDRIDRLSRPTANKTAAAAPSQSGAAVAAPLVERIGSSAGLGYISNLVVARLARYLDRHTRKPGRWAIATRRCQGQGLVGGGWPAVATYDVVADDGRRYFADPFLFERGGRAHLFAEELPLATGRGLISVAEIDAHGLPGAFRPIIERPFHLSYPFVFSYAGAVWMIPEACESGTVELHRAVEFPYRWELDRVLLGDVAGCDATIVPFAGSYYMILTAARWHGSSWDTQRVFHAPTPLGPWQEQIGGLVRVDCRNSRPAGAAFARGGRIMRPAQNSSSFYGGEMTVLEVEHLSSSECLEKPVATIKVSSPAVIKGTHTYSKTATFEAVDVWGGVALSDTVELVCTPIAKPTDSASASRHLNPPADITDVPQMAGFEALDRMSS